MSRFRTLLIAAVAALSTLLCGCASQLTEDEEIALAYAETERREAIREYVRSCEAAGYVVIYTGRTYQKLQDPVKRVPSHARLADYACASAYRQF